MRRARSREDPRRGGRAPAPGDQRPQAARRRRPDAAPQIGLTQQDVASERAGLARLGSGQVRRTTGSTRATASRTSSSVQTPQYRIDSIDALERTPVAAPGSARAAAARQRRHVERGARRRRSVEPLQRAAGLRRLRQRAGPRPRRRRARDRQRRRPSSSRSCRRATRSTMRGPGREHAARRSPASGWASCSPSLLVYLADGRELPELARPVHHHHGAARGAGGHRLDAVR